MLLFPLRRVHIWFLFFILPIPAFIALGIWIAFQIINGMGSLGGEETAGGIAYAAHIGGFIAGFFLVKLFVNQELAMRQRRKRVYW